jgi:hypothetical protein
MHRPRQCGTTAAAFTIEYIAEANMGLIGLLIVIILVVILVRLL